MNSSANDADMCSIPPKSMTTRPSGGSPSVDVAASYTYDSNDRLLTEATDSPRTANDRFTVYEYGPNWTAAHFGDHTTTTKKTVYAGLGGLDDLGLKLTSTTSA